MSDEHAGDPLQTARPVDPARVAAWRLADLMNPDGPGPEPRLDADAYLQWSAGTVRSA